MRKYGARRDVNEARIVPALRKRGATVRYLSAPGLPDLLVGFRGVNYLLEVKAQKGKLTPPEQDFFDEWRGQAVIVRSIEDALIAIGAIDG
jgi:hypothetical protein